MKGKILLGLMLCAVLGIVLTGTTATENAQWSGPEPSGIVAITD